MHFKIVFSRYTFVVLTTIVLFMVYPILIALFFSLFIIIRNKRNRVTDKLVFTLLTFCACLVQSSRIWRLGQPSDWYNEGYWGLFKEAGTTSFFSYVIGSFKEPIWSILNYIGYYLTSGNYYIFINSITILSTFLCCYAIFLFWKKTKTDTITLAASLALIIFFSEYLNNLNNITRQMFATSIVVYVFSVRVTKNKTLWFLLLSTCFIHTFSFIYLALFLIKPLYQRLTVKNAKYLLYAFLGGGIGFLFLPFLGRLVSNVGFLAYGFNRLEKNSTGAIDETVFSLKPLYITTTLVIILCFYIGFKAKQKIFIFHTNLLLVLMAACMVLASTSIGLVSRMYISRFFMFPFVLPYVFLNKKVIHSFYVWAIFVFFGLRFFFRFDTLNSAFFPSIDNLLKYSLWDFVF